MKIAVIPDIQVRPGDDLGFLESIAKYLVRKKPDLIVCIGDFADMPSLCSYDYGTKSFEGRRYIEDVTITKRAINVLTDPIHQEVERLRRNRKKAWNPELILTLGNHEDRITRAINSDPKLDGTISIDDLGYSEAGWTVVPYLEPVVRNGIAFCHYFTSGTMGRPVSSARALVNKKHMSCVMGHAQNYEFHREVRADGTGIIGLFVGACNTHTEDYLGPQGNDYWRGIWMLHEVKNGEFQPMQVSLNYLVNHYA